MGKISIQSIKDWFSYDKDTGEIYRVRDMAGRGFVTHEEVGYYNGRDNVFSWNYSKEKSIQKAVIAWVFCYNELPDGRIFYKDGNFNNLKKENLICLKETQYYSMLNTMAVKIHEEKEILTIDNYNNTKGFVKALCKYAIKHYGLYNILANINSKKYKGHVQKGRIIDKLKELCP